MGLIIGRHFCTPRTHPRGGCFEALKALRGHRQCHMKAKFTTADCTTIWQLNCKKKLVGQEWHEIRKTSLHRRGCLPEISALLCRATSRLCRFVGQNSNLRTSFPNWQSLPLRMPRSNLLRGHRSVYLSRLSEQALDVRLAMMLHEMLHVPLRKIHEWNILHRRDT